MKKINIFIEMVICVAVGVVMLNHGLVDPDPHVAWKLDSHVELFIRWKEDLEEAPKWILTAFWRLCSTSWEILAGILSIHGTGN